MTLKRGRVIGIMLPKSQEVVDLNIRTYIEFGHNPMRAFKLLEYP